MTTRTPAVSAARVRALRTFRAADHLVLEQAVRVLREVFRCRPHEPALHLVTDEEEWEHLG